MSLSLWYKCAGSLTVVRAFERGQVNFKDLFPDEIVTYESNIAYTLRFMIDTKVSCPTLHVRIREADITGGRDELGRI